ncbi:papain-like cysteine peptidase [Moumouvirus goulette]|uniref:Papain-like cysteine peptidase n=1 Tax=Moumouvirus goulette TaxID=1247379 RepID=M1PH24_9VIRU|nr:papain-like cysteine peptidase [Moumouvirus goulette]AGF85338.1 papain-like cysteine peptidase [Moumouvirus goulette]
MTRYISLGSTCGVAYQLQQLKLRGEAMPFDWIKTCNLSSIIEVFGLGFSKFVEFDSLQFHSESIKHPVLVTDDFEETLDNKKSFVYKNSLNMIFYHDFNSKFSSCNDENYTTFYNKYERRFNRLNDAFVSGKKLVFIRDEHKPHTINIDLIKKLIEILNDKMQNGTIFKLIIIINNPKNKKYEWIEEAEKLGIKIINDDKKLIGWKRDNLDWMSIIDV